MGFTFDDTDTKGIANPLAEMHRLIASDPSNAKVIFPFIGYSEVANDPAQNHHRYAINFGERSEEDCRRRWPDVMAIVEEKVKPDRVVKVKTAIDRQRATYWWRYGSPAKELASAVNGMSRVLVAGSQASTHYAIAFLPGGMVYSSNLTVFAVDSGAAFASLQSRVHEVWARFFMSTMKDDLAYTPTTCFEPFPFSDRWDSDPGLDAAGAAYYDFRAALMVRNDDGLTKTYNRFHDPYESDPAIVRLRELHTEMDRAVLAAYRWDDVPTDCEFLLDYEIDEAEWGNKKKPYRYRWPDEVRDEVLARLIALNAERAQEEQRSGAAAPGNGSAREGRASPKPRAPTTAKLF
jgi:hypothetical protein